MTEVEKLKAARSLIEKGWTQFAAARDVNGKPVPYYDPLATQFCALGACHRVDANDDYLYAALGLGCSVGDFNDRSSKTGVLALYDQAVALAEREAAKSA